MIIKCIHYIYFNNNNDNNININNLIYKYY